MRRLSRRYLRLGALLAVVTGTVTGCETVRTPTEPIGLRPSAAVTSAVPAKGTSTTLDFGTWNLEWFGDPSEGPGNEALQLENIRDIITGLEMDLWSVQEVTGETHFADLVSQLSGYDGFLANDPFVTDGAAYYSDFENNEMKVGIIYRTALVTVHSARVILKENENDFAGRPPVEVELTASVDGQAIDLVMILLHGKAGSQGPDWERRLNGSIALKNHIDTNHPTARVMVIGDFNDDVDKSITRPKESPYKNFVDDAVAYVFPTKTLSDAGVTSTVYYSEMIDHHLATNELIASYVDGSAEVFPADQYLADYDQTTSDHYPVLSRYTATSGGGGSNAAPSATFTFACTDLACSFDGTGSSDPDGDALTHAWDFGDGSNGSGSTVSHTFAAGGSYTVTLTVSDGALSDSDAQTVTVSESGGGGIQLSATGYKVQGQWTTDLTWAGATATDVDVYRDGTVITTTPNDGAHTDRTNFKGGGSLTYRICEAGTATCSNEVTVNF